MCRELQNGMYYYVAVRTDIPVGDQICQVSHASIHAGREFQIDDHCNVVALDISSKEKLLNLAEELKEAGIRHFVQVECDDDMGETCLITEALQGEQRKIFRRFQLVHS